MDGLQAPNRRRPHRPRKDPGACIQVDKVDEIEDQVQSRHRLRDVPREGPGGLDLRESRGFFAELVGDPRWVAFGYDEGGLIGYAVVQDYGTHLRAGRRHHGRLHDLYVVPDKRRTGVGQALMDAVTEWASTRVRYLEWQAHHERAAPFYERLGHRGQPCPQPDYPTFEIEFAT